MKQFGSTLWTKTTAQNNVEWSSVSISSSGQYQTAVMNQSNGYIATSSNYGQTWISGPSYPYISSVSLSSSGQYQTFVIKYLSNGGIYISSLPTTFGGIVNLNYIGVTGYNGSFYVKPINSSNGTSSLVYNSSTGEVTYNSSTGSKTFVIDHPVNSEKYLVHACLEGPEAGVYYRGKGIIENNDYVKVILPDYVSALASDFTIQLTPIYDGNRNKSQYFASEVLNNSFNVYGDNGEFYWTVYAKRNDIVVEPNKDDVILKGYGPYLWI